MLRGNESDTELRLGLPVQGTMVRQGQELSPAPLTDGTRPQLCAFASRVASAGRMGPVRVGREVRRGWGSHMVQPFTPQTLPHATLLLIGRCAASAQGVASVATPTGRSLTASLRPVCSSNFTQLPVAKG
ncbi:hypothetical protein AAFF_G00299640 [Aldrovandia affinis]|uniref:Uncharacterized protein n=1 Tax=Aldrovandia affinis TaxID=143900 RepID=A0AAD7W1J5_9TELE|nr:hypothetical protein AAFF_G00299640 [Aldrovandia affinis]